MCDMVNTVLFKVSLKYVTQMKSKNLSDLSSNEFSSVFFFVGVIDECQKLVYPHASIYS